MMTRRSEAGTWIAAGDTHTILSESASGGAEGERRLMIAVLLHALRSLFHDAERPGRGALRRLRQDLGWITSPDRSDVFAFERICEAIGIDSERVRQHVMNELGAVVQLLDAPPSPRRSRASRPPAYTEPISAVG